MNILLLQFKKFLYEIIFNISQNNRLFSALKMFVLFETSKNESFLIYMTVFVSKLLTLP